MPLVINTNVSSLNAQRQLVKSGQDLDQATERLSSGKRINTAADDAAGLAISNRQTSAILGLNRAMSNASDGISLIQTAEGALEETTNILQRIRELSIQSANGIYSDTDRATLDAEAQQLVSELDRIAETTSFNGQKILDGSLGDIALQVGSNANETIDISIKGFGSGSLGSGVGGDIVTTALDFGDLDGLNGGTTGDIKINTVSLGSFTAFAGAIVDGNQSTGGLGDVLAQINSKLGTVEATAFVEVTATAQGTGILQGGNKLVLTAVNQDGLQQTYNISGTSSLEELASAIGEVTGGVISAKVNADGLLEMTSDTMAQIATSGTGASTAIGKTDATVTAKMVLTSTDGAEIKVDIVASTAALAANVADAFGINERTAAGDIKQTDSAATFGTQLNAGDIVINGVEISAWTAASLTAAIAAVNRASDETGVIAFVSTTTGFSDGARGIVLNSVGGQEISIDYQNGRTEANFGGIYETNNSGAAGKTISNIDISTAAGAQSAIDVVDGALEAINSTRADLGAINNRLDFTVSNLMNVSENTAAARSRIVDADFAAETAELSRAQVLQQASSAMLAQANARPQQVLSLLQ